MSQAITITAQTPYLTQYLGVWAILESAADLLRDTAAGIDWSVHLTRQIELREKAAMASEPQPSMYSYTVTPDGIAVIDVVGSLMKQESSWSDSTSTVMLRRTIRHAVANDRVKAIMMRYDSPGGTVSGTEDLADDIRAAAAKKPLAAYADGLMASAAYWLGAQANWIAGNETATVGSIGVLAVVQDRSAMAALMGVKVHVIKSADAKGAGVPGTEITPRQLAEWQRQIDAMHGVFVRAVAGGRGISTEAAAKLADARVHVGRQALDAGLIDYVEGFDAAVARLGAMTGAGSTTNKPLRGRASAGFNELPAEAVGQGVPAGEGADATEAGDVSPEKGADMSQTTQPAGTAPSPAATEPSRDATKPAAASPTVPAPIATAPTPAAAEPKPATIGELKAAFPGGANAEFVLAAAENAWTMAEARSAHAVIESRVASAAAATANAAPAKKVGVEPSPSAAAEQPPGATGVSAGSDAHPFIARRDQLCKEKGLTRAQAVMKIAAEEPELHQSFMAGSRK